MILSGGFIGALGLCGGYMKGAMGVMALGTKWVTCRKRVGEDKHQEIQFESSIKHLLHATRSVDDIYLSSK